MIYLYTNHENVTFLNYRMIYLLTIKIYITRFPQFLNNNNNTFHLKLKIMRVRNNPFIIVVKCFRRIHC